MREFILKELEKIEAEHDVKIIYAVESGSRGWGFASPDSDYDVRFIYAHRPDWYLSIEQRRDFIELPADPVLDINGWDIRKALMLFKKSNPPMLEWLHSPVIYVENGVLANAMRALIPQYFSAVHSLHHYFYSAKNTFSECSGAAKMQLKKYFYMLRPLLACKWIETQNSCPPMEFNQLLDAIQLDNGRRAAIDKLLRRKIMMVEGCTEEPDKVVMEFIKESFAHLEPSLKRANKAVNYGYGPLNDLFRSSLIIYWQ